MKSLYKLLKDFAFFIITLALGTGIAYGVLLFIVSSSYGTDFALTDDAFKENKYEFAAVAVYAEELYEKEKKERDDLTNVDIVLWGDVEVVYRYEDGSERRFSLIDEELEDACRQIDSAFPSPGGEFSVGISAYGGTVKFSGCQYSLLYSSLGTPEKPEHSHRHRIRRVSIFFPQWYHCYCEVKR